MHTEAYESGSQFFLSSINLGKRQKQVDPTFWKPVLSSTSNFKSTCLTIAGDSSFLPFFFLLLS